MDERETTDEELARFYKERLITLSDIASKDRVEFFPVGADASVDSYYSDHESNATYLHQMDAADLKTEFEKMWADGNFPALAELAGEIADLAKLLKEKEESDDEISPFIYAMF